MPAAENTPHVPPEPSRRQLLARRPVVLAAAAMLTVGIGGCDNATAAADPNPSPENSTQEQPADAVATVDLGEFSLRQTRPLEESTLNIRFRVHATASGASGQRLARLLEKREHQAREQVIVAVRTAETWEFDEPELTRLRRRIQLRLNRWVDANLVEDVVLTDYRFRVD